MFEKAIRDDTERRDLPGQQMSDILLGKSGEIALERMKRGIKAEMTTAVDVSDANSQVRR